MSTTKGSKLFNSSLKDMLRYNATHLFIETFDRITKDHLYQDIHSDNDNSDTVINSLLIQAAQYGNTEVFKYLSEHRQYHSNNLMNIVMPPDVLSKHGNAYILQRYLEETAYRPILNAVRMTDNTKMYHLPLAIDSGSIQYVRLLLQHLKFNPLVSEDSDSDPDLVSDSDYDMDHEPSDSDSGSDSGGSGSVIVSNAFQFKRRGVSVEMLRVLHEEFNSLFGPDNNRTVWQAVLIHSVHCNMLDSVRYILQHMPAAGVSQDTLFTCLEECAKSGNIDIFEAFTSGLPAKYFKSFYFNSIVSKAVNNGHESFIKQLYINHPIVPKKLLLHYLQIPSGATLDNVDISQAKLTVTPLAAIRHDDIVALAHSLTLTGYKIGRMDKELCRQMSEAMASRLSSPTKEDRKLKFDKNVQDHNNSSLINLIKAIGKPGSNITEDIVCDFIANCKSTSTSFQKKAMEVAAIRSPMIMMELHTRLGIQFSYKCLANAIKHKQYEAIEQLIASLNPTQNLNMIIRATCCMILGVVKEDLFSMLETFFDFEKPIDNVDDLELLTNFIYRSYIGDRPDIIQLLKQCVGEHSGPKTMQLFIPELSTLCSMAKRNAYRSLNYHFNSTTFTNMSTSIRLRTLHSILNVAYQHGAHRVIEMCNDLIKSNSSPLIQSQSSQSTHIDRQSSQRMDTSFHLVFRDRRIGMMIMGHVGHVHKCTSNCQSPPIKGAQLLANNSLIDYIRYGTTEWFLKAYSMIDPNSIGHNTLLLNEAMIRCNTRVIDVLLANPNMSLPLNTENKKTQLFSDQFINAVSQCTHPEWERVFDEYLMITAQTSPLSLSQKVWSKVSHPLFIRKLINVGVELPKLKLNDVVMGNLTKAWLKDKPWALEMLKLLMERSLITCKTFIFQLLLKAIKFNATPVVQHLLEFVSNTQFLRNDDTYCDIILWCGMYGRVEHLDMLYKLDMVSLSSSDVQVSLRVAFGQAAIGGHLAMAKLLHTFIMSINPSGNIQYVIDHFHTVLANRHLDMLDFILSIVPITEQVKIDTIHHRVLSVDLIERLLQHPNNNLRLGQVLASAIKGGNNNREVVEKLLMLLSGQPSTDHNIVNYNYHPALKVAAEKGDLETITRLMDNEPTLRLTIHHIGALVDRVGTHNGRLTDDDVIEWLTTHPDRAPRFTKYLSKVLAKAASKSHKLIKFIVGQVGGRLRPNHFKTALTVCMERGDIQSMEYIIQLALKSNSAQVEDVDPMDEDEDEEYDPEDENEEDDRVDHNFVFKINDIILSWKMSCNIASLEYLFDKRYVGVDKSQSALQELVDEACKSGRVDIIRMVHKHCATPSQLQTYIPSMESIYEASDNNHHQVLSYLFEGVRGSSSPFQIAEVRMDMSKLLRAVRMHSCTNGNIKIIKMCDHLVC
ncbi:hypothetical protein SAMD00019534_026170 [Acytostelium subglobosum LB1]|uniref:hypothetical protein n=1 Tax=Acytostelium subglobosum LB1 TaxID=1410327 RepID=UPI000644E5C8|nr:hypothetical protein SAMD00019534_026170 [Acytostelium subglobosum LB1]GAM19442.1 hypothetical protein SAMD00019534_026170 [Acytostelium subglobosum LB1]|eukprot:XP_012757369.1 hypothetical protein SAMD00019534_026170 [Acytostelium subglobosum LB1]